MPRFLIVKTSSLGDVVHALPCYYYLKKHYPGSTVDWIVEKKCASLLTQTEGLNPIIVDSKAWRKGDLTTFYPFWKQYRSVQYDYLFDLQGNFKSCLFTLAAKARVKAGFSWDVVREKINILGTNHRVRPPLIDIRKQYLSVLTETLQKPLPEEVPFTPLVTTVQDQKIVEGFTHRFGNRFVILAPFSAMRNKMVPSHVLLQKMAAFKEFPILVLAYGKERELGQHIASQFEKGELLPELGYASLQLLMSKAFLVVAMDSFPLHLAGSIGAKIFALFGPTAGNIYAPQGINQLYSQGMCPYGNQFIKQCPALRCCPTGKCMEMVESVSSSL